MHGWQLIEVAVHVLELQHAAGSTVIYDATLPDLITGTPRQIDVLVETRQSGRLLRRMVEVRDRGRPVSVEFLDQVQTKQQRVGAHRATIVSTRGFSRSSVSRLRADAHTIDGTELRADAWPDWWKPRVVPIEGRRYELQYRSYVDVVGETPLAHVIYAETHVGVVCLVLPPGGRAPDMNWWIMSKDGGPTAPSHFDIVFKYHDTETGAPGVEIWRVNRLSPIAAGQSVGLPLSRTMPDST
jgi:hypothetical protein